MSTGLRNLLLTGLGILAVGALVRFGFRVHPAADTHDERASVSAERDRETLRQGEAKAGEGETYGALVRLGRRTDPDARAVALKYAHDRSPVVRSGAANALGNFDDAESLRELRGLLADSERIVRVQAIHGLSHVMSAERRSLIAVAAAAKESSSDERVAAYSELLALAQTPAERGPALEKLVALATDRSTPEAVAGNAAIQALNHAPRDPQVVALARTLLESGRSPMVAPMAIRTLASASDAESARLFGRLAQSADLNIRIALAQAMGFGCRSDRYEILALLLGHDENPAVAAVTIQMLQRVPSGAARKILAKALEGDGLSGELANQARAAIKAMESPDVRDPCAKPAARVDG